MQFIRNASYFEEEMLYGRESPISSKKAEVMGGKKMEDDVFVGTCKNTDVYLNLNLNANRHMLLTGSTGTGKTNFLKNLSKTYILESISSARLLVLNFCSLISHFLKCRSRVCKIKFFLIFIINGRNEQKQLNS